MIEPALTAEEWSEGFYAGEDVVLQRARGGIAGCPRLHVEVKATPLGGLPYPGRDLHALAALALDGQPFGFTHEDVDLLRHVAYDKRDTAATATVQEAGAAPAFHRGADLAESLANRIEALLPPITPAQPMVVQRPAVRYAARYHGPLAVSDPGAVPELDGWVAVSAPVPSPDPALEWRWWRHDHDDGYATYHVHMRKRDVDGMVFNFETVLSSEFVQDHANAVGQLLLDELINAMATSPKPSAPKQGNVSL